jgi:hypothetical protein
MATFAELEFSFFGPGSGGETLFCPVCGQDIQTRTCAHVLFVYMSSVGLSDIHESIADLASSVPDDEDPDRWITENIDRNSVLCISMWPLAGEDAEPISVAFDFAL